jgi:hypothetical protein
MSPLVAYHATRRACRDSILRNGLLGNSPNGGRPFGVYVFRVDGGLDHVCRNSRLAWDVARAQDLWQVAYIGPVMLDRYVLNAAILLAPATHVTLVAGSK